MIEDELADVIVEQGAQLWADVGADGLVSLRTEHGAMTQRQLEVRRSLTPSSAHRLVEGRIAGLVIADMIDSSAGEVLKSAGWSFWDRRGRLRVWLPELGYRLDVPTRSFVAGADGPERQQPVAGVGGLSIALALLIDADGAGVRSVARDASLAASTISRARGHLEEASLINSDGTPLVPELFWAASDAWITRPIPVDARPDGESWVLSGDAAAARWGAPVFASRERYYCASRRTLDRFVHIHRSSGESTIEVAVAPTPLVVAMASAGLVDPVVAALDLSRTARGREILRDWQRVDGADLHHARSVVWQ